MEVSSGQEEGTTTGGRGDVLQGLAGIWEENKDNVYPR